MRNGICKNENQQFPSVQGRAVETTNNLSDTAAETTPLNECVVKATLHHLSGQTSSIQMTLPRYSDWGEFLESGSNAMREYVFQLTRHFIKISHFYLEFGMLKPDGSLSSPFEPRRYDIPLGKVYAPFKKGEWFSPEQHPHHPRYDQRGSSKDLIDLAVIVGKRNEAVYSKVDENTTLCGVPYTSLTYYFNEGDIPSGTFEHNGTLYAVVYRFVKTQEGGVSCA
jgi:hypothetical protein